MLDFIRYEKQLVGTKIGCREGDCGACTALVGTLKNGEVHYQSVTSCITPMANVEGKHVVTIEGLNGKDLTPVQQAFVEAGGTQCGFCTVGFIVSLTGYCLSTTQPTYEDAIGSMDGNICRCTGYKSIERATHTLMTQLNGLNANAKLDWLIKNGFVPDYFQNIQKELSSIHPSREPTNGTDDHHKAIMVGGGTDLYVQCPDEITPHEVASVFDRPDLHGISVKNQRCEIGASSTVTNLMQSSEFNAIFPNLRKYFKLISSTQIRNMGTVGGNLVNASPIGDLTIFFIALNSSLTLCNATGKKRSIMLRDFYKKYKTIDKADDEYIEKVWFETPGAGTYFNFEKVSKRTNLDIASVNSALQITLTEDKIKKIDISAGGVGPIPLYLKKTSAFLTQKELTAKNVLSAVEVLHDEISPISDARGSKEYKSLLLRQLLFAHFIELFPHKFELKKFV